MNIGEDLQVEPVTLPGFRELFSQYSGMLPEVSGHKKRVTERLVCQCPTSVREISQQSSSSTPQAFPLFPQQQRDSPSIDYPLLNVAGSPSITNSSNNPQPQSRFPIDDGIVSKLSHLNSGKVRKYTCTLCRKGFDRPSALKIHANSHTGAKPYACQFYGCCKRYSIRSNMLRHLRSHITPHPSDTRCMAPANPHGEYLGIASPVPPSFSPRPVSCTDSSRWVIAFGPVVPEHAHTVRAAGPHL